MRPIPHVRSPKMTPFSRISEVDGYDGGQAKANPSFAPPAKVKIVGSSPMTHRKSYSISLQAKHIISPNPLPLKKHGCGRSPIHSCSEASYILSADSCQFMLLLCVICNSVI